MIFLFLYILFNSYTEKRKQTKFVLLRDVTSH